MTGRTHGAPIAVCGDDRSSGRRLFLLLGMHRSGTSLGAKAFSEQGLQMEGALARESAPDNLEGYFEDREIVALHDRALHSLLGSDDIWSPELLWSGTLTPEAAMALESGVSEILERRFAGSERFGFKDPRTSTFLPAWVQAAARAGIEITPVLFARSPGAVGASLRTRQGMPSHLGQMLWLKSLAETIKALPQPPAAVLPYDRWFTDPGAIRAEIERLIGASTLQPSEERPERPELRHHQVAPAALPFFDWIYAGLIQHAPAAPPVEVWRGLGDAIDLFINGMGGWRGAWEKLEVWEAVAGERSDFVRLAWPSAGTQGGRSGEIVATLLNGNPWCEVKSGSAYQLHPSRREEPPPTLVWGGFAVDGEACVTGRIELWPNATAPVEVKFQMLRGDEVIAHMHCVLEPGSSRAVRLPGHAQAAENFRVSVSVSAPSETELVAGPLILRDLCLSMGTTSDGVAEIDGAMDSVSA